MNFSRGIPILGPDSYLSREDKRPDNLVRGDRDQVRKMSGRTVGRIKDRQSDVSVGW